MYNEEAWVVAVDMGYGHQRAAFPLRRLSPDGKVLVANNYPGIPGRDRRLWRAGRKIYEFFSRLSNFPLWGDQLFGLVDRFQKIDEFYPRRDLSRPTLQLRQTYRSIRHGWGRDLINLLNKKDIPLVATFFTVAFFAEEHKFKNDIYLVVTDSDVSRAWAPLFPGKSRIRYLAPCRRVVDRLKLYGVKSENIFLTGFPLPEENLGAGDSLRVVKNDLAERIINLDPEGRYRAKYGDTAGRILKNKIDERHDHPLTLTFAVGGAGAQRKIAADLLRSLRKKLLNEEINLNLIAGTRNDVYMYFRRQVISCGLKKNLDRNVRILFDLQKEAYFEQLDKLLRTTDMLWTKPSELVFYTALGIPVIMAPSVGSQEDYNRVWLKTIGAGIAQNDPRYTDEWLTDWVRSGWLAEAAMSGFLDGRQFGVSNICDVVFHGGKHLRHGEVLL